jgi:hypothetical protein
MRSPDFFDSANHAKKKIIPMTMMSMATSSFHNTTREQNRILRNVRRRRNTILTKSTGDNEEMRRLILMRLVSVFHR